MAKNKSMYTCSSKKHKIAFVGASFIRLQVHMEQLLPKNLVRDILLGKSEEWTVHTREHRWCIDMSLFAKQIAKDIMDNPNSW